MRDDADREIFLGGWVQASRNLPPCRPIPKKRLAADRALRRKLEAISEIAISNG
jgi:hypothetical protein